VLDEKEAVLLRVLSTLTFNQVRGRASSVRLCVGRFSTAPFFFRQALVFCNLRGWAEALADRLTQHGFPAAFTCGAPQAACRTRALLSRCLALFNMAP
jgi:superfamily II DNA/RNA helicase